MPPQCLSRSCLMKLKPWLAEVRLTPCSGSSAKASALIWSSGGLMLWFSSFAKRPRLSAVQLPVVLTGGLTVACQML